jgi:hypothetical protein
MIDDGVRIGFPQLDAGGGELLRFARPRLVNERRRQAGELVLDGPGLVQEVAVEALDGDIAPGECNFQRRVDLATLCVVAAVPVDAVGFHGGRQFGDHVRAGAVQECQSSPMLGQRFVQGLQRAVQPPPRGAAQGTDSTRPFIMDVDADQRAPGSRGRVQRGIIGEAQIVAEPNNCGIHVFHTRARACGVAVDCRPYVALSYCA